MLDLADAIVRVRERIASAALRAGRDPAKVRLIAVTKTLPVEVMVKAHQLGLCDLGENRVEEALDKIPNFKSQISNSAPGSMPGFHMIGHLQSRKVRDAVALFDMVHSVDSLKLAQKLSQACTEAGRVMPVLLECNVSGEASKYGFQALAERDFFAQVEAMAALPGIHVEGLMTMAPIVSDPQQTRPVFAALRQLGERLGRLGTASMRQLSMGMTDDFEIAIEEGATMVRIGRALFAAP